MMIKEKNIPHQRVTILLQLLCLLFKSSAKDGSRRRFFRRGSAEYACCILSKKALKNRRKNPICLEWELYTVDSWFVFQYYQYYANKVNIIPLQLFCNVTYRSNNAATSPDAAALWQINVPWHLIKWKMGDKDGWIECVWERQWEIEIEMETERKIESKRER